MAVNSKTKKTKEAKELCRIVTPEFRVAYPHVFVAQAPKPTDKKKYSVTMLFPKDSDLKGYAPGKPDEPRKLGEVIRNAKIAEFGANKEDWPELESPVTDGDHKKNKEKEGYAGHWVIKATSTEDQKPTVLSRKRGSDGNWVELTDPKDFYPGCYARAHIFAYVWEYMGKQGVGFILDHVQKTRDGDPFGGKRPAHQVFGALPDDDDLNLQDAEDDNADFG